MKIAIDGPEGTAHGVFVWRCGMCEARIYIQEDGKERKLMEDVVLVQPEGDAFLLVSLLGEQRLVRGHIQKIDFLKHTVHIGPVQDPAPD
jgi:predicted RNA-binding protein